MRTRTSEKSRFELIQLADPKFSEPHIVSLETSQTSTTRIHDDGSLEWTSASIELTARYFIGPSPVAFGELVSVMGGSLQDDGSVRLTNGEVMVRLDQLRGLHIGSVLFARVVDWAKLFPPDRRIYPITVSVVDAMDEDNKIRRNTLYDRFGIKIPYRPRGGIADAEGRSDPGLTVGDLIQHNRWEGVELLHGWGPAAAALRRRYTLSRPKMNAARHTASFYRRRYEARLGVFRDALKLFHWWLILAAFVLGFLVKTRLG